MYINTLDHLRQELCVQCWNPTDKSENGTDTGHLDVYSTTSVTTDFEQVVSGVIKNHGHGTIVFDSTLPNTTYAASLGQGVNQHPTKKKITLELTRPIL